MSVRNQPPGMNAESNASDCEDRSSVTTLRRIDAADERGVNEDITGLTRQPEIGLDQRGHHVDRNR